MPKKLPWWLTIVVGVAIIGATFIVDRMFDLFSVTAILLTIVLVVLSSATGGIIARLTASQKITKAEEDIQGKIKNLGEKIKEFQDETKKILGHSNTCQSCITSLNLSIQTIKQVLQGKFGESLVTYEYLKQIEGNIKENGEIWVLTSALQLEDSELKEAIRNNFKKGIRYKYLIPKEDKRLQKKFNVLAQEWMQDCNLSLEDAQKQIQCYLVPKHFAYMTVIIYDPYASEPTVLVKFPTSEFYEKEKYPLIYRVDTKPKEAWVVFVEALQELIDNERKCSLTEELIIGFSNFSKKISEERK